MRKSDKYKTNPENFTMSTTTLRFCKVVHLCELKTYFHRLGTFFLRNAESLDWICENCIKSISQLNKCIRNLGWRTTLCLVQCEVPDVAVKLSTGFQFLVPENFRQLWPASVHGD